MHVRMCDVHKTERAVHGPFSARLWSVQYPFQARFRAVLLKRSGVKRTVHGRFFGRILYKASLINATCAGTRLYNVYSIFSNKSA